MRMRASSFVAAIAVKLAACGGRDNWVRVKPAQGGFVFSMPTMPSEKVDEKDLPLGHLKLVTYVTTKNDLTFSITYTDYPSTMTTGRTPADMLDPGIEKMLSKYPAARVLKATNLFQGFPARSFSVNDPTTRYSVVGKACLVGKRTYVIQAVMPSELAGKPEITRFIESFQLLP